MILLKIKSPLSEEGFCHAISFIQNLFLFKFLNFTSLYQLRKFTLRIKKNY